MKLLGFLKSTPSEKDPVSDLVRKEYEQFMNRIAQQGSIMPIEVALTLKKDEFAYLETPANLHETRSVSTHSSSPRVGFRVMKGVYIGSGGSGRSESHQELQFIDKGALIITNQRLMFVGNTENRVILMKKIISVQPLTDAIAVSSEARAKTMFFVVANPLIWITVYQLVTRTGTFGAMVVN